MTQNISRIAIVLVAFAVTVTSVAAGPSRTEGLAAWEQVYSVLTHPRCSNCHTATDHPDQGDDRHRHAFNVVRGPEGQAVRSSRVRGGKDMKMSSKSKEHQNVESQATSAPQGEAVNTSPVDSPRLGQIRIRAYEIYMERGGQPGHDLDDWLQAERELEPKVRPAHAGQ